MTLSIIVKIVGAKMLARGEFKKIATFATLSVGAVILSVPAIAGSVIPSTFELAFDTGKNVCEYDSDTTCVPFFTNVFGVNATGGKYSLPFTFYGFIFGVSTDSVFDVMMGVLLACKDFDTYMLYSTIAAGMLYIPAILVVTVFPSAFQEQAFSYYIGMDVPQFVLILAFLPWIVYNLKRMKNGIEGPCSDEVMKPDEDQPSGDPECNEEVYKDESKSVASGGASCNMTGTVDEIPSSIDAAAHC